MHAGNRPVHKHADKLKSDKNLKEGTKPFIEHRLERKVKLGCIHLSIESRAFSLNRIECSSLCVALICSFVYLGENMEHNWHQNILMINCYKCLTIY